ncbi:MAG: putative porin [Pseudomonadota bacterium]
MNAFAKNYRHIYTKQKKIAQISMAYLLCTIGTSLAAEPPEAQTKQISEATETRAVRVPYLAESVRNTIKDELRNEIVAQAAREHWGEPGALPEWIGRIKWGGDLRIRYQKNIFSKSNAPYENVLATNAGGGYTMQNTTENYQLYRLRARIGMQAKLSDAARIETRIASGSPSNPISTNQTMGNSFNRYGLALDLAAIKLEPWTWWQFGVGRTGNPWFGTDLVWASDLGFEGAFSKLSPNLIDGWPRPFVTVGAFPLEKQDCANAAQNTMCANDKWLYGAQMGLESPVSHRIGIKFGVGYYDYKKIAGAMNSLQDNANKGMTPKFVQRGNTVFNLDPTGATRLLGLAADYTELNMTGSLDIALLDPTHLVLIGDYVNNVGYDRNAITQRTSGQVDVPPRTKGYLAKLIVGKQEMRKGGDWQVSGTYKYLQRDAVVDAYTDSDLHLGGTDTKGWVLGLNYGITTDTWMTVRWLTADQIDGPPLAIDVVQIDLGAKF